MQWDKFYSRAHNWMSEHLLQILKENSGFRVRPVEYEINMLIANYTVTVRIIVKN